MPRRLRIEFDGALDHVITPANARKEIVQDDEDRHRIVRDLGHAVTRSSWGLLVSVVMNNHLRLLGKTTRPNVRAEWKGSSGATP